MHKQQFFHPEGIQPKARKKITKKKRKKITKVPKKVKIDLSANKEGYTHRKSQYDRSKMRGQSSADLYRRSKRYVKKINELLDELDEVPDAPNALYTIHLLYETFSNLHLACLDGYDRLLKDCSKLQKKPHEDELLAIYHEWVLVQKNQNMLEELVFNELATLINILEKCSGSETFTLFGKLLGDIAENTRVTHILKKIQVKTRLEAPPQDILEAGFGCQMRF